MACFDFQHLIRELGDNFELLSTERREELERLVVGYLVRAAIYNPTDNFCSDLEPFDSDLIGNVYRRAIATACADFLAQGQIVEKYEPMFRLGVLAARARDYSGLKDDIELWLDEIERCFDQMGITFSEVNRATRELVDLEAKREEFGTSLRSAREILMGLRGEQRHGTDRG